MAFDLLGGLSPDEMVRAGGQDNQAVDTDELNVIRVTDPLTQRNGDGRLITELESDHAS